MHRRHVLQLLATGAALQLAPAKLFALAREAQALVANQPSPRSLNSHQYETVKTMAEMIIPRTETPGATDVGVADFIDLILTEWSDDGDRTRFFNGIADVDSRANNLFGKDFVACPPNEQSQILIDLGEAITEQASHAERFGRRASRGGSDFYSMFRRFTLTAYYTSEAGATKELGFEIIPDGYDGCAPTSKEAAKS